MSSTGISTIAYSNGSSVFINIDQGDFSSRSPRLSDLDLMSKKRWIKELEKSHSCLAGINDPLPRSLQITLGTVWILLFVALFLGCYFVAILLCRCFC
uniref:Uncharacterized protein n=1 Tax=Steinernema glaseri TaxID=37863 RepID=A0A1I7YNF0_9BILA